MKVFFRLHRKATMNSTTAMRIVKVTSVCILVILMWQLWLYMFPVLEGSLQSDQVEHPRVLHNVKMPGDPGDMVVPVNVAERLEIYYEALCPDSRHFIMKQLVPAYSKLSSIMDIHYVPYGKAFTRFKPDGTMTFICQHGPKECEANKVHACVAKYMSDPMDKLNTIACMININYKVSALQAGKQCVLEYKGNWAEIEKCSTSGQGDAIMHHMGKMTSDLNPKATFIPTITIDGSQEDQKTILRDLSKAVCMKCKGLKPPACP